MKNLSLAPINRMHDPMLEEDIASGSGALNDLARKNAIHHADKNMPAATEQNLAPYVADLKHGYGKLISHIHKHIQPDSHFTEARMEIPFLKEKDDKLAAEIDKLRHQNSLAERELGKFNPKALRSRISMAIWTTVSIAIGEILYNAKAFQVIGENMLFAIILSIAVSVAVFAFSHFVPFLLKGAKTKFKRRLIITGSLLLITTVFSALAVFRTQYLAAHGVQVNPVYFVVVNLFFFIVASLLSFFVLPTWKEFRENAHHIKEYDQIEKRKREIKGLEEAREENKKLLLERNQARVQLAHYAQYKEREVKSMFRESLGIFQSTNLIHRTDRCVPLCFSDEVAELEIERFDLSFMNANDMSA